MKTFSRAILSLYLFTLLWLVLFKFSFDLSSVLDIQVRSLNLIPFAGASQDNLREMVYNLLVFIPFGLLFGVNFKRIDFWHKLIYVFFFSLAVEMVQFMLAIGVMDITDVITNTLGGFIGLGLYELGGKHADHEKLDRLILVIVAAILILFILLRVFVLRAAYHSAP